MDAILALLNRLAAATTDDERAAVTTELNAALAALTSDELAELDDALRAQLATEDEARQAATTTEARSESVARMQTLRDGIVTVGAEADRRDAEQATLDEQAAAILAEVSPSSAGETPAEEGAEAESETPAEVTETPAETPETTETTTAETPEAVAASATPRPRRAPLSALNRVQPRSTTVTVTEPQVAPLVAALGAAGVIREGAEIPDRATMGRLLKQAHRVLGKGNGSAEDRVVVATGVHSFADAVVLGDDPVVNADRIAMAQHEMQERAREFLQLTPTAQVAAGGFCGIFTPIYDAPSYAQRGRPVHDGFAIAMQWPRGGISYPTPLSLADIPIGQDEGNAVWLWDNETDTAALDGDEVKPCWHIDCGEFTPEMVQAVGLCLEIGNLGQMTHPERFAQAADLADAAHDRVSETLLLDAIKSKSVNQTRARTLGAAKDFFAALNILAAGIRATERTNGGNPTDPAPLIGAFPTWLIEAVRIDILRSAFPGETSWDFSVERMMALFRAASVVPTFYVDTPTGAGQIPTVADGGEPMDELPTHAEWGLALPGSHLVGEAPEINLGLVRDSALNAKNNARVFRETFQGHAYIGTPKGSVWVRQELCADGSVADAVDTTGICGTTAS